RILSIHPAIREDIPKGIPLMGVDVEATPVIRLDDPVVKDDDQITVNSVDELSVDDMLMIVDGRKTEFCHIEGISDTQISVSDKLLFDHEEGTEIKRLGLPAALDVKLAAVGPAKSSELQVAGGGIQTLRVGEVVRVDNPERVEYFQITGISGHEIGLGSSETIIQLGGIVTNDATPPAPIIGAKVTLSDSNGMSVGETFTDSEGKFAFKSLVEGEYNIKVSARGYAETTEELGEITSVKIGKLIIKLKSI
ncbi:MAG: carboxypeptidase regulatory-like domain-containing protein, partial [Methanosarcinales archaeon]|nr:carboxypeptidase regulatory-like domain-containing protein [Methanosarcinales archaeon]